MERRASFFAEIRNVGPGRKIGGLAAKYGVLSRDLGGFKERIKRGAFSKAVRSGQDVKFLFNHNPSAILGSTKAGTLSLRDTSEGLEFECDMPKTTLGQDTYESIRRGDISSCSFSFALGSRSDEEWGEEYDEDEDNPMAVNKKNEQRGRIKVRNLLNIPNLYDVSAVTYPAYESGTSLSARDSEPYRAEVRNYLATLDVVEPVPGLGEFRCTSSQLEVAKLMARRQQVEREEKASRRRNLLNTILNS